jgi:cyclophilin family peptidyl-prolyl cis-trans isomerase
VADANHLDAGYVVFGKVTSGLNIAKEISKAELATGTVDRPAVPVTVIGMAKL